MLPSVLRNRDFGSFWAGVVLAEIGSRATVAASLFQVYDLTGSTAMVGLVGLSQAAALLVLSPLGGVIADRLDRRRLLQLTQVVALVVTLGLGLLTFSGHIEAWHVLVASLLTMAAATFDRPARIALTAALVPHDSLAKAVALLNPSREIAVLVGPALAGVLIAVGGAGLVYVAAAVGFGVLVVLLLFIRVRVVEPVVPARFIDAMKEGVTFIRRRPIIWSLMGLDLVQTVFAAYRVLLPAFALDILHAGATGYGLLLAAPSLGALLATPLIYRLAQWPHVGRVVLVATMCFGVTCIAFAQSRLFVIAIIVALFLGVFDALGATIRLAAVQLETPDALRGRVTSLYQLTARGGPGLGDANMGWIAALLGPMLALTIGGLVPVLTAAAVWRWSRTVRDYVAPSAAPPEPAPGEEPERPEV